MTDGTSDREKTLDRIVDEIRGDGLDRSIVSEMIDRTWSRIDGKVAAVDGLHGCDDLQSVIPALVAGELSDARALLVEDHTRECLACRRVLMEARGVEIAPAASMRVAQLDKPRRSVMRLVAAAAVILGVLAVGVPITGNLIADRGLEATIQSVDGSMFLVDHDAVTELGAGDLISSRRSLRTGKQTDAVIRLADGSLIEVDERSELSLEGGLRGTTIRLTRGNIIVRAAAQERGRLYVSTEECLVAVKGTVFAVDHGLKGSRVSVIEGEVEVRRPGSRHLLSPGEQITTSDRLRSVAIREQIAWSRNAEQHAALLNEITTLQRAMAKAIEPETARTSTRLLDLAPADTRIFVAAPNLAEGLAEARTIFEEQLASSDVLRQWWQANVVATGVDLEIDAMLDRIEPLAEAAGDEVVVAVPGRVVDGSGGPLVLFTLDDPAAFESLVTEEIAGLETAGVESELVLIDDPRQVSEAGAGLYIWIAGDLFASSPDIAILAELAARLDDPTAPAFPGSDLHQRLSESYARGISWLLGVDVGTFLDQAAGDQSEIDVEMLELIGLLDAGILIAERRRDGDLATITAELTFDGTRKGIAAWLAEPAAMGSLEFISPDASLAAAVVAKDPVLMFDELMTILARAEPTAVDELENAQAETGFDLRADLAATLGGEVAFAIDGPLLPTPAWKLIVEVYDPGTLQRTIERAVADANRKLEAEGEAPIDLATDTVDGIDYYSLEHPKVGMPVVYAMLDGFMVVAPQQALVQRAFQHRSSGVTLADSSLLREMLPTDGFTDCSALVFRNLGELVATLPAEALGGVPPETLEQLGEPGVFCAYGLPDRILVSGTGSDMLGFAPAFGLTGLISQMFPEAESAEEPLSSGS